MNVFEVDLYNHALDKLAKALPDTGCSLLVTGATGMIGSCIVDLFLYANRHYDAKYKIYALGRNADKLKKRFPKDDSLHYLSQDIMRPIDLDTEVDYIIHAASNADPQSYARYPAETILTNIVGAQNVLDYCKGKSTRALLTSTFEVYGKLNQDEYSEDDFGLVDQNQLRSAYPESKRTAELLFRSSHHEFGVDCLIARLPSVYGPTMSETDNKAHAEFFRNAANGQDIVLKSEGSQKRSYSYVMDIVSGLLFLLFHGNSGEAYNVANSDSVATIAEMAHLIAKYAGRKVVFQLPKEVEKRSYLKPQNTVLNTDKIRRLGWNASFSLAQGVKDTLSILWAMK